MVYCLLPWGVQACSSASLSLPVFHLLKSDFISAHYPLAYTLASCYSSSVGSGPTMTWEYLYFFSKYLLDIYCMPANGSRLLFDFWCAGVLQLFARSHGASDLPTPHWLVACTSTLNFSHFDRLFLSSILRIVSRFFWRQILSFNLFF